MLSDNLQSLRPLLSGKGRPLRTVTYPPLPERILEMEAFSGAAIATEHDRDYIEPERALPYLWVTLPAGYPHLGHAADLRLFPGAHGFERLAATPAASRLHFDEGDESSAAGDDVDLAVAAAEIAFQHLIAPRFEMLACQKLSRTPTLRPGIAGAASHLPLPLGLLPS